MFEKIKNFIKGVLKKLNKKPIIEKELNIEVAVSDEMIKAIDLWTSIYNNKPPWINENVKTIGLAPAIAGEFARLVTLELESVITGNDYINEQYQIVIERIRDYCEFACAKGGVVFKPYISDEDIAVDLVQAENFYPTSFNSKGEVTGAIFLEFKQEGKKTYTRVEYHNLTKQGYYISNTAYVKENYNGASLNNNNDLGDQVPLGAVKGWEDLEEEALIKNVDKPLFSYFKIPIANNIDTSSPLGVSVYSRATDLIEEGDKQYSRILWEYEGTELAVNAGIEAFALDREGNPKIPVGKERLYRTFDIGNGSNNKLLDTFSPDIRDAPLFNGLNQLLRKIEFNCGLAYGTLSDVQETAKTATEIKTSRQRSYVTVSDIQKALEKSLINLAYAMNVWAMLAGYSKTSKYDMSFKFDDSLVIDKDTDLLSMQNDVASGLIRPELYIMKKYGVTEEEALKMMPNNQELDEVDDLE
ncbi:phage portal protein [Terrisporobacter glycolicus]|uniref:Phage minor capsid protein n=1 Tax=Terrisporobacter glycolicus ATCC 14880 = DSM 1288 TaxID=1121315 RepID=A0ABZ2EX87_9FIRM|nr:phage portal protein [Terrisporobacter glycolicus]